MSWEDRTWDRQERTKSAPAKKNRRRWCRGKVGVEHKLEVMVRQPMRLPNRIEDVTCRWWPYGRPIDGGYWICYHKRECITCGKILEHGLSKECPLWTPPPWEKTDV